MAALTVGDRDLLLGRETLTALASEASFPFLAANLVDANTGKPVFAGHASVTHRGIALGFIGLVSPSQAKRTLDGDAKAGWTLRDLAASARDAAHALTKGGAEALIVLSHLSAEEERAVAAAVPGIRLFLGGQSPSTVATTTPTGADALSVSAGQKGKYVGVTDITLVAGLRPDAPWKDDGRAAQLASRIAAAKSRVRTLEARIAGSAEGAKRGDVWQRHLTGARADLKLLELEAAEAKEAPQAAGHLLSYVVTGLSSKYADEATVAKGVAAFREDVPDPAKNKGLRRAPLPIPTP